MLTSCAQSCEECTAPRASVCSVLLRIAPGSHTPRLISSFARGLAGALRRSSAQRQAKHRETKRSRSRFHSLVTSCDRGVSSDSGRTDTDPGSVRRFRANKSVVHLIYDLPENCCGNAQQTATGCDLFRGGSPWRRASSFLPSGERKKRCAHLPQETGPAGLSVGKPRRGLSVSRASSFRGIRCLRARGAQAYSSLLCVPSWNEIEASTGTS